MMDEVELVTNGGRGAQKTSGPNVDEHAEQQQECGDAGARGSIVVGWVPHLENTAGNTEEHPGVDRHSANHEPYHANCVTPMHHIVGVEKS